LSLALGVEVGATTVAAVLASVLAERVGRVAALCVCPDAGGLTARLPAPPSPATDRTTPQLEVRTVAEQDAARTAGSTNEDVTVLDPGCDLGAAARHGLLDWADQLVVVLSAAGESTGQVVPADWLVVQGHAALARDTVTVVVGLTASDPTAPVLSYDGRGQPVVHLPFDAHLKEGEVVDLTRLSVQAAAAAQQLAALVGVPSADGPASPPPPSAAPVGLPGGLSVPSLVVDSGASDPPTPVGTGPAFGSDGSGPPPRPLRTVVICTVLAVLTVVGLSRLDFGSDGAALPAACAAADGLPAHAGHPTGAASCVGTQFGEQAAQENNPTLLIVEAPSTVRPGEDIEMQVSIRNLVRDAFPAAAHGGYYSEPAELTAQGLTRGHVHAACRVLASNEEAPPPDRATAFAAIEDGNGGAAPDTVEVHLSGRDTQGAVLFPAGSLLQCAAWAGDGSHRIPMDAFPNQVPAFDAVRVTVAP